MSSATVARRFVAEALGSALLLAAIVGSGIMAERLAGGNIAIALLANTAATGAMLFVLIVTLGPISGAHFNPVVSLVTAANAALAWRDVPRYIVAQLGGALGGVGAAHVMFGEPVIQFARHPRSGPAQWFSEFVATFGLLLVILGSSRYKPQAVPAVVGLYITSAYWFTASTSFANPAVTLARSFTDTFAGIQPSDVPGFVAAQCAAAAAAMLVGRWLFPNEVPSRVEAAV